MAISNRSFRSTINTPDICDAWGQAYLTDLEAKILYDLRSREANWQAVSDLLTKDDYLWEYLQRLPDDQIEEYFQMAAIAHGCPVAVTLYNDEKRDKLVTIWSYLTKNRIYRTIRHTARKEKNMPLLESWTGSEDETTLSPDWKVEVIRPEFVGTEIPLQGIEKIEVYWVCQMLRVLEALRLEIGTQPVELSESERAELNEARDIVQGKISAMVESSENDTSFKFAVNTFFEVLSFLRSLGLKSDKVVTLLWRGFDPKGPLQETGLYNRIKSFWDRILTHPAMVNDPITSILKGKCDKVFTREG